MAVIMKYPILITLIAAIIGVIFAFKYLYLAPLLASKPISPRQEESSAFAPPVDLPFRDQPTERLALDGLGGWNTVMCWPSVGGIIINRHVTSVELDFLHLSRFEASPRSSDSSEEDSFCRQLRLTGGKWWQDYWQYDWAAIGKMSPMSAKERETLVLGWPEDGGVWVMRGSHWDDHVRVPFGWTNAHTMEERCKALEMAGAVYYSNPEDCEAVKALLDGFGEHEREPENNYYYDRPADIFREL